jgi:hypothetical protein
MFYYESEELTMLFPWLGKRRPTNGGVLDRIEVARSVKMNKILEWHDAAVEGVFMRPLLRSCLAPEGGSWCGLEAPTELPSLRPAPASAHPDLDRLLEWGVMEETTAPTTFPGMVFFSVPKKDGSTRAIMDCREINRLVGVPPALKLIEKEQLFFLLRFFRDPFFATGDLRHWFYQLSLPPEVREAFTLRVNRRTRRMTCWPMGFSWSPIVAQAITMIILREAAVRAGFSVDGVKEESPPPYWVVRSGAKRKIVAFLIGYYDNILIISGNEWTRDNLTSAVKSACKDAGAELKGEIVTSKGETEMLGLRFRSANWRVWWEHAAENKARWAQAKPPVTYRDMAGLIGVILWDWSVRGSPLGAVRDTIAAAEEIGAICSFSEKWDAKLDTPELQASAARLLSRVLDISRKPEEERQLPLMRFEHRMYLATDAMKERGAGITMSNTDEVTYPTVFPCLEVMRQTSDHLQWIRNLRDEKRHRVATEAE